VKHYSGDIPTRAMFDLLKKSGCVEQEEGKVYLVSHAYVPGNDPADVINILGADSSELMNTIIHNMSSEKSRRRFQRKVSTRYLDQAHLEAFRKYAGRRSQNLLEELDNWLSDHEARTEDDARYVSLGIYYFQDPPEEETPK
jgi:ATPase subunit of ABC transporter with duplicated ATPase domains